MNNYNKVTYREALTASEIQEVHTLEMKKMQSQIRCKLDPGTDKGILCRHGETLTGFMTADCFGGPDIESAALVNTRADWEDMAAVLIDYAKEKSAEQILFIASPKDILVTQILTDKGLTPSFSEYRMIFDFSSFSPVPILGTSLRQAAEADVEYIIGLDSEAFGGDTSHITPKDVQHTQIVMLDEQPVGKLRIEEAEDIHGIYGIIIERQFRNKGIGSQALTLVLGSLSNHGAGHIYLEVDSENPAAFHLYKKLGFTIASEFCYYPYKLK